MRNLARWCAAASTVLLAACASVSPAPSPEPPDFTEPTPMAAPARSVLYTDCLAQAIDRPAVARLSRSDAELLRFTCTGAPAQRFYEALGVAGGSGASVWQDGGRTFRATAIVRENLFGVDYCSSGAAGDAICQIVLNAGPFLAGRN